MKHILRYAPIAAALLLITSCASKKAITDGTQLPTQTSKTDKNAEKEAARQSLQFVQRIANNNVATENILTSGDFTLQLGSKEITVPAKLSMRKDECIRIQLLMPILRSELARIEFTPNYVLLLDRYHKEYIKASYSEVSFLANNGLSFYSLQALFWNQLIAPGAKTITEADLKKFVADVAAGSSRVPVTLKAGNITYKWSVDAATALIKGADFATLAQRCSDDKGSARRGGDLSWAQRGYMVKEFEDVIFSAKVGEISKPFLSPYGYHIVRVDAKQNFFPYDTVRADIHRFIESRGLREHIISQNIDSIAKHSVPQCTPEDVLNRRADEMAAADPALKSLIREYHDGLLLYEISNRTVWDKAAKDEAGLAAYFKKNRKRYKWEKPRFKGIAYWVKEQGDVEAVKASLKKVPFEQWPEHLRKEFNDSTIRIKVVKGIFREGDNALIDKVVFGKDTTVADVKDFPISATYGEKLKAPKTYNDVRELVVTDYQEQLEKAWIEALRKRYTVVLNKEVLSTVNKH